MKRVIKFRAWNPVDKVMGDSFTIGQFCGAFPMADNIDTEGIHYMQFTGLTDKHGVEIYEGDVVKFLYENYKVIYFESYAAFMIQHSNGNDLQNITTQEEVIGNIYQHPHLLTSV